MDSNDNCCLSEYIEMDYITSLGKIVTHHSELKRESCEEKEKKYRQNEKAKSRKNLSHRFTRFTRPASHDSHQFVHFRSFRRTVGKRTCVSLLIFRISHHVQNSTVSR